MNDLVSTTSINTFESPEDAAAEQAYNDMLGEAIQSLKALVGPDIKVTLTNEFGASMTY
jgi:FPC/CPF motif-containing protein YcgG